MLDENDEGGITGRRVQCLMGRGDTGEPGEEDWWGGSSVIENGWGKRRERSDGKNKGLDVGHKGKSRLMCSREGIGGRCGAG